MSKILRYCLWGFGALAVASVAGTLINLGILGYRIKFGDRGEKK